MKYALLSMALGALGLSACTPVGAGIATGSAIYLTKPSEPPPADTADQIPPHESWCYSTAGDPECFAHPQDVPPGRLINVDPASRYPIDLESYRALVAKKVAAQPEAVQSLVPPPLPPVVQPVVATPVKPVRKPTQHRDMKGKHKKKAVKPAIDCVPKPHKAKKPAHAASAPISLQPPPLAPDMQTEKSKLQEELNASQPPAADAGTSAVPTDATP